ncbi:hypothetical protein NEAUS04_0393 [Nematocida ausubeli]|uniref:Uncharacterized protein n=1 Tax=Nematocida ausubeli (strain ATCC PRA-371 / ERTm2) TaxID=1913371 RepID=H8ZDI9_NEMA1|nr:uncharacterized protein NESG_00232 [Nematocida ausubeli]EHY65214.1 hypothetical protein NERG_01660 [Nematocida ausubeli]KAI5132918.1 hypothetical protein NEAUS07_0341 [Nematocida ausubeli]KAI5146703.1 hypothetical protein NEAUS05_0145 [Nematocida ausubeli]KAI5161257.1 hypothetical protein NEAUS04_0393 [Nematocida ausubeli]KFG27156.1 hypothetical protein NESG_00232 [Nematocida ausubeli]
MEGETYGSISRASESGVFCSREIEFIHGRRTEEGIFRVMVERRITRTKYLVQDVSGKGILNLEKISSEVVAKIVKRESKEKEKIHLLVIGKLQSKDPQEFPVLDALSITLFTFENGLQHILRP